MSDRTKIEWADCTWQPVTGCTPMSAGCANCYAARMAKRLQAMKVPAYRDGFKVRCHPEALGRDSDGRSRESGAALRRPRVE